MYEKKNKSVSCCYALTRRSRWNIKKKEEIEGEDTGHSTSSHSDCLLPVEAGRHCWRLREATLDISECSLGHIFLSQPDSPGEQ